MFSSLLLMTGFAFWVVYHSDAMEEVGEGGVVCSKLGNGRGIPPLQVDKGSAGCKRVENSSKPAEDFW